MDEIKISDAAKMAVTRKAVGHINRLFEIMEALTRLRTGVESGELPFSDEIAAEALTLVEEGDLHMEGFERTTKLMDLFMATEGGDDDEE